MADAGGVVHATAAGRAVPPQYVRLDVGGIRSHVGGAAIRSS